MSLTIPVPDDVQASLEGEWGDLARHLQESLAVDGYSKGVLGLAQVRRLLGMATRLEAQEFLGRRGVAVFDFDPSELDREAALLKTVAARE
jgi:predicted HTH domain antitoxin